MPNVSRAPLIALLLLPLIAAGAAAQDLVLKRVVLSTGGVGYFEYAATVTGDGELRVSVPLAHVDDVLKSLVVYDDKGGVGAVRLPGRQPLAEIFRDLPFGPADLAGPVAMLNAMTGADVEITGPRALSGRLLSVRAEIMALPDGAGQTTRHRISLITKAGLQQAILEQADGVRFTDAKLQAQFDGALAAVAGLRNRDRRQITIATSARGASGPRDVRIGYVVAAPLWKTAYRLSVPAAGHDKPAHLQGWAVIENLSGQAWDGVELTLTSGNPVTFRQALYDAYYVERPAIAVQVMGRVLPPADTGAGPLDIEAERAALRRARNEARRQAESQRKLARIQPARRPMAAMTQAQSGGRGSALADLARPTPPPPPLAAEPAVATEAEEATTQIVFRYAEPVHVAQGDSLAIPIIDRDVPAERLALYQRAIHASHPLAAVRLVNESASGLPPGVLTLYEIAANGQASFVGDARLSPLPPGESRLLSFALDQKTTVRRTARQRTEIVGGSIAKGVFLLRQVQRGETTYALTAPRQEDRAVLLEHPIAAGWTLLAPKPDSVERTKTAYRIPLALKAGESKALTALTERPLSERISLSSIDSRRIAFYARSTELSSRVRQGLMRIAELKQAFEKKQREADQVGADRERIVREQARLRDNLRAVPNNSTLYRRYLDKLDQQETILEALDQQRIGAREAVAAAAQALTAAIANLVAE